MYLTISYGLNKTVIDQGYNRLVGYYSSNAIRWEKRNCTTQRISRIR